MLSPGDGNDAGGSIIETPEAPGIKKRRDDAADTKEAEDMAGAYKTETNGGVQ